MRIGILALQGAFIEHEKILEKLGVESFEIRQKKDIEGQMDGIIIPGGESTVQGKLLKELGTYDTIKSQIESGMPVLATCAGLILLADNLEGGETGHLQTMPVTVKRNAYGRQLGSFHIEASLQGIGKVPMTFIRAPYVAEAGDGGVQVLATVEDRIVAVKYKNQLALAFHPELDENDEIHKAFLAMCENRKPL